MPHPLTGRCSFLLRLRSLLLLPPSLLLLLRGPLEPGLQPLALVVLHPGEGQAQQQGLGRQQIEQERDVPQRLPVHGRPERGLGSADQSPTAHVGWRPIACLPPPTPVRTPADQSPTASPRGAPPPEAADQWQRRVCSPLPSPAGG
ncbi:hypothetical protein chiPu_0026571, partial [Chiloscyllium punctatum]|nr:hypothetical protein [Chiloscyllium punctatum]